MENISRIIQGGIAKDHKYQKMVYDSYRGLAMKIVFRYIYAYEKAAIVVNDGFVKLFLNFERFVPADSEEENRKLLTGYITKIMVNTSIDALRKTSMSPEIGGFPENIWDLTRAGDDADQGLLYKEIVCVIRGLPPRYRIVFNMYEIDGFSHPEIAELLQIPVGTSKSNLSRAKTLIQEKIKKIEQARLCSI